MDTKMNLSLISSFYKIKSPVSFFQNTYLMMISHSLIIYSFFLIYSYIDSEVNIFFEIFNLYLFVSGIIAAFCIKYLRQKRVVSSFNKLIFKLGIYSILLNGTPLLLSIFFSIDIVYIYILYFLDFLLLIVISFLFIHSLPLPLNFYQSEALKTIKYLVNDNPWTIYLSKKNIAYIEFIHNTKTFSINGIFINTSIIKFDNIFKYMNHQNKSFKDLDRNDFDLIDMINL